MSKQHMVDIANDRRRGSYSLGPQLHDRYLDRNGTVLWIKVLKSAAY